MALGVDLPGRERCRCRPRLLGSFRLNAPVTESIVVVVASFVGRYAADNLPQFNARGIGIGHAVEVWSAGLGIGYSRLTTTASEGLSARVTSVGGEVGGSGGKPAALSVNVRVTMLPTAPASSVA